MGYMGSYYNIPKAIFYLLQGNSRLQGLEFLCLCICVPVGANLHIIFCLHLKLNLYKTGPMLGHGALGSLKDISGSP